VRALLSANCALRRLAGTRPAWPVLSGSSRQRHSCRRRDHDRFAPWSSTQRGPRQRCRWSPGASQIPEALQASAFTPAAVCGPSGERLAPLDRGLVLRRRSDGGLSRRSKGESDPGRMHGFRAGGYLFESGWVAPGSVARRGCWGAERRRRPRPAGLGVHDQAAVGDRVGEDRLLEQPVEEHPASPRAASVEPERELVEVRVEVLGPDRALVCPEQPALEQQKPTARYGI
jgi:hypothetical protein